jgi:dephospho-CoA kinase
MSHLRIGLTGGIGSGKSTVAEALRRRGAALIDADAIVKELTAPGGRAIAALRDEFGPAAIGPDGGLDRASMRARAFGDPEVRRRLEAIVHPLVRAESDRRAGEAKLQAPYIVFVIPLLIESGDWRRRVHRVLVVDCTEQTQFERVMTRPGLDAATTRAIIAAQCGRPARLAAADDVIFNEAPLADIEACVSQLHDRYLTLARSTAPLGSV